MPRKEANNLTSFETEFERLNAIVEKLEQGNVPLAEMLSLYEEAMALAEKLKAVLNEAELKVEKLAAVHEEVSGEKIQGNDILENEDLF
jgi:exodeoxyribonuclease VII small subunit